MNEQEQKKQVAAEIAQQLHDIIYANDFGWNENTRNSKPTGYFLVLANEKGFWTAARRINRQFVMTAVLEATLK